MTYYVRYRKEDNRPLEVVVADPRSEELARIDRLTELLRKLQKGELVENEANELRLLSTHPRLNVGEGVIEMEGECPDEQDWWRTWRIKDGQAVRRTVQENEVYKIVDGKRVARTAQEVVQWKAEQQAALDLQQAKREQAAADLKALKPADVQQGNVVDVVKELLRLMKERA